MADVLRFAIGYGQYEGTEVLGPLSVTRPCEQPCMGRPWYLACLDSMSGCRITTLAAWLQQDYSVARVQAFDRAILHFCTGDGRRVHPLSAVDLVGYWPDAEDHCAIFRRRRYPRRTYT